MDLEQLESLALSGDRAAALSSLLPGTPLHDYWRGVHLQHEGKLAEVDALLAAWPARDRALHDRLSRRQLLLRAGQDLGAHAEQIRIEAGLSLDDQAEAEVAAQRLPTRLPPAFTDAAWVIREGLDHDRDLSGLTDWALPDLIARAGELDAPRRRALLDRLPRANLPGVAALVAEDLAAHPRRAFGEMPIVRRLTLAALDELAARAPDLRRDPAWVTARLARLAPPDHVDIQIDQAARRAHLDALWGFVEGLAPTFNNLKAQVLHHLLDLDRREGVYDRARLVRYLELPRQASYAEPSWLRRFPSDQVASGGGVFVAGIDPIQDDEGLVRDHLLHFLSREEEGAFAEWLRRDWLRGLLVEARLTAGDPDVARWTGMWAEERLAALRDRVEIDLSPRNPRVYGAGDPVALDVIVKNVPELTIKVFRVNVRAYFLKRGAEVDTSLDLDGLVAGEERVMRLDAPPIQRTRQRIDLPACDRPGTYLVELIGNGVASRALIRKGSLRHRVRVGAAGPTLRVFDEAGRALADARVWMGGRAYEPREDGEISIPFSTRPGSVPALIERGDLAQVVELMHPAEQYQLRAGIHLEREALVPGKTARAILRPTLTVAGWPAPIALLEEARVEVSVTDLGGTASTKIDPVTLRDDADHVISIRVPEDVVRVEVTLRGRVRLASTGQGIELSDSASGAHNQVHVGSNVEVLHLASAAEGYVIHALGKAGEPLAGRPLTVSIRHAALSFDESTTLAADDRGRVELGPLPAVQQITATLPSGVSRSWSPVLEASLPSLVHAEEGAAITLPAPPGIDGASLSLSLSLHELRGHTPAHDRTDRVRLDRGALVIEGLTPGRYTLAGRGLSSGVLVRVVPALSPAEREEGWATAGSALVELSPPLPVIRGVSVEGEELVVRVSDAGPETRVHLVATRFLPDAVTSSALAVDAPRPQAPQIPRRSSEYVSGRDIGDEARYVLERRRAARRPGMLLDKPSLLLDPWARRATSTATQSATAGTPYPKSMAAAMAAAPIRGPVGFRGGGPAEGYATADFLSAPAVVIDNLRPDDEGVVRVPRASIGGAAHVRALLIDPDLSSSVDLALPEVAPAYRDRRLALALDPARHFAEDRGVDALREGDRVVIEDVRTGKLELVSTVARAHQVLLSLSVDEALRELSFITEWHALDAAARRAKYSKYACHELNLFLSVKDPAFFAEVVLPHLKNRRHRTFVDRFLLGEDLSAYLDPWAFGRLNALERVLLARRIPALRDAIVRLTGDEVDLFAPDPERDARLLDALLGAAALEEGGLAAAADAVASAPMEPMDMLEMDDEASFGSLEQERGPVTRSAPRAEKAKKSAPGKGGGGRMRDADMRDRGDAEPLYRGADQTQEWAETGWWKKRIEEATLALIPPTRLLRDLAAHREGPFLSPHLAEHTTSFASAMACLTFLDLPFVAGAHETTLDDVRLTVTAKSAALAARTRLVEIEAPEARGNILVGQSYFRADDRYTYEGAEAREKYVTGEMLAGVVYQCQVVVTNPTSRPERLDLLLQIPRGAVPVASGFLTRTKHLHLGAYGTHALEYAFYFPAPGTWTHFPAHVLRDGALLASAAPATLTVVRALSTVDTDSWAHVSQHGTLDEVLAFLDRHNLGRLDLDRVAFRMHDREAFTRVTALLAARHTYHDRLWAYALAHGDRARAAEWLRHQEGFLAPAGPVLEGALLDLEPLARGAYQHLEYAPLINARAHRLGRRERILNEALDQQYRAFLDVVAHRARPSDDDLLSAAHYLFAMDRVDDALAAFDRVRPDHLSARMPYAYLAAYAACCRGDLAAARRAAAPFLAHPVDRWRLRFAALTAMLDEAEGRARDEAFTAPLDPESRDQQMNALAARQPALSLTVERGALVLSHHRLTSAQLRFHRMDTELYFSRQPFLQGDVDRFSWIEPGLTLDLPLDFSPGEGGRTAVPIPESLAHQNLVVEAQAGALSSSVAFYAHDLAPQLAEGYGQLRVLRASTQAPLAAAYVKVFARQRGGGVSFFKDGYTDLRGRFDYATLSTDDLDRVERFSMLIAADEAGATVVEAGPPKR